MAVERGKRVGVHGREAETDVAVGTDKRRSSRRNPGAGGIDVGVVRNLHEIRPAPAQARERFAIGVVAKETISDIIMAIDSVTANSRNSRPTMPPISKIGMNTAISEMLIDRTVKVTSAAPWIAALTGGAPASM